ncbi:MAG TPA: hypothetical protein VL860_10110, partial [Planctomycetota bacterium]|nr:hypothetical protein [Planctomycetota bacterium]
GIIFFVGAVVTAYTLLGGIEAVIWTDVVQVILLSGGALLCLVMLVWQTPGGPVQMVTDAYADGKLSLAGWDAKANASGSLFDWNLAGKTFLVTFLFGVFENLRNYNFEMVYVQRYATVSSVKDARRSAWLSVWMYIGLTAVFLLIGTALHGYYAQSPALQSEVAGLNYEQIFPHFINSLPAGIRGLVLVAILAAGISTVDSSFNVVSTIYFSDIHRRFFDTASANQTEPNPAQDAKDARVLRWSTYVMGAMSIAFAFFCLDNKNILDRIWGFAGLTGSGLVGLFLIGIFLPRASTRDALFSLIVGSPLVVLFALWSNDFYGWQWLRDYAEAWHLGPCPLSSTLTLPLGVCLHCSLGYLSSLLPQRTLADDSADPVASAADSQRRHNLTIYGLHAVEAHGDEIAAEPVAGDPAV